jgi:hypothetical protein
MALVHQALLMLPLASLAAAGILGLRWVLGRATTPQLLRVPVRRHPGE